MAAAPNRCVPDVVDLSRLRAADLDPLLAEEQLAWRSGLNWDFTPSANLVRRFMSVRALTGFALVVNSGVVGYCYYVCEDRKGLIGDLYIRAEWSSSANEDLLLGAVLQSLMTTSGITRIEAQLMMLHGPFERALPLGRHGTVYPRLFMLADLEGVSKLPEAAVGFGVERWEAGREEDAARLIAASYRDHIDSDINDQYRSVHGARRFLHNVVNYPGCGRFFDDGSYLASASGGQAAGLVLSSIVASETGHVTQICVAPEWKGRGVGYELMRRTMNTMVERACERCSLTVTSSNRRAITLYQNLGFRAVRHFAAYVWEGF